MPTAATGPAKARLVRAPRGSKMSCKTWAAEAALRMLANNLDPEVAENPQELVVYGGRGQAARSWEAFDAITACLRSLEPDETLLVQSGKPVGVCRTTTDAPRVLIANSNLVPHWATQAHVDELAARGLIMFGQMTAGSWIYIGTQGILQGTYETFAECARQHFGGTLKGRLCVTAGCGGMGGAQPLAVTMNEGVCLLAEMCIERLEKRVRDRYLDAIGARAILEKYLHGVADVAFVRIKVVLRKLLVLAHFHFVPQCIDARIARDIIFIVSRRQAAENQGHG